MHLNHQWQYTDKNNMIELAKLNNKELVYGTYEEVENYALKNNTCVDRYLDHVAPFIVQKEFKYIGNQMGDPYAVSTPWDYEKECDPTPEKW